MNCYYVAQMEPPNVTLWPDSLHPSTVRPLVCRIQYSSPQDTNAEATSKRGTLPRPPSVALSP